MRLEGEIGIEIALVGAGDRVRIAQTTVRSTRPHAVTRMFAGKPVAEVVAMLPRLYSLCGCSQGIASVLACEAAAGIEAGPDMTEARRLLVGVESFQESLLRVLIDWPRAAGETPMGRHLAAPRATLDSAVAALRPAEGLAPVAVDPAAMSAAQGRAGAAAEEALSKLVLGMPFARWNEMSRPDELAAWSDLGRTVPARTAAGLHACDATLGACDVPFLPSAAAGTAQPNHFRTLAATLASDPAFSRAPHWNDRAAETGALARMHGHPLVASVVRRFGASVLARFVARVAEMCAFASGSLPVIGKCSLGGGRGAGWAETSRGLLLHAAEIVEGRVRRYGIVAPTEWNFHPQGALVRGAEGRTFADEAAARRALGLLVQSLDPCVAWTAEWKHG
jgi:Ni,Fe-hydrogenase I large subunit